MGGTLFPDFGFIITVVKFVFEYDPFIARTETIFSLSYFLAALSLFWGKEESKFYFGC